VSDSRADDVFEEWRLRADGGETVDVESVIRAHPEIAEDLRVRFEAVRLLDGVLGESRLGGGPKRVGEYRVLRELGRGGMGVVYEAEQESMGRRVALKVLHPSVAPSSHAIERFRQEARIAGSLKHTNIVAVHALGEERGLWYCAMELVEGPPLSRVLENVRTHRGDGPHPARRSGEASTLTGAEPGGSDHFRRVARMFAEVADALEVAHREGVLHRDVKPSNLLLDADGHLRLVDFGLARIESGTAHFTRTGDVLGTPLYMSPEQFKGTDLTARSDVYSLGATLYEVLTLRPPHEAPDPARLAVDVLTKDPAKPRSIEPRVPRDLETIVLKALEKDPGRRYASAAAMAEDLRAFGRDEAIHARRVGPVERALRWVKRHPARTTVVALATATAVAAVTLTTWAKDESTGRRLAEYRLLLQRAATFRPSDANEGHTEARRLYDQAIAMAPELPDAWFARAVAGDQDLDSRLQDLEAARARGAASDEVALARARLRFAHGDVAGGRREAAAAGDAANARAPLALLVAAADARARNDSDAAVAKTKEALALAKGSSIWKRPALAALCDLHLERQEHAAAIDDIHAMQALGDDRLQVAAMEPLLWRELGNETEAAAKATSLSDRVVGSEEALFAVLHTWQRRGSLDWAEALSKRAVARHPRSGDLWGLRACVLDLLYRFDEAIEAWEQVGKIAPDTGFLEARFARTLCNAGRIDRALEVSERATKHAPDDEEVWCARSEALRAARRFPEAEVAARRALEIAPKDDDAMRDLASILIHAGHPDEAERTIRQALLLHPSNPLTHKVAAQLRLTQERFAEALAEIDAALQVAKDDSDMLEMRGQALQGLGRWEESADAFRRSLIERPRHVSTLYALGLVLHVHLAKHDEAERAFRTVLEIDPANSEAWNELGNTLKEQERDEDALVAYRKALALAPDDLVYLGNIGGLLTDMKRTAEALDILDRVVARLPDSMVDRFNRALALADVGRREEAVAEFREVARRDPKDGKARIWAAANLFESGRREEAIGEYLLAIAAEPENATYRHDLAVTYLRLARYDDAIAAGKEAIRLAPKDANSQSLVGHSFLAKDRPAEAMPFLEEAVRLEPGDPRYAGEFGTTLASLGREGQGVDVLVASVKANPDEETNRRALAWILVTAADLSVRDATQAVIHARKATQIAPTNPLDWAVLGAALVRQGRWSEAIARLDQARGLDAEGPEPAASYFLAIAYAGLGKADEAKVAFARAERLRDAPSADPATPRVRAEAVEALKAIETPPK
jgi:serine/threonine protein kinase/tetratricopeptide (TPR) repeat protein